MELADNRTDKFVMPVFSLNVINDDSRAIDRLACLEFISVPTGFGRGNDRSSRGVQCCWHVRFSSECILS